MGGNDVTRSLTEVSAAGLGFLSRTWEVWWTRAAGPEAIAARAMERSSALIRFARAHSPFYRAAWKALPEAGLTLASLPVVTKHRLMARFDDWVTDRSIDRAGVEAFLADRTHVGERFLDRFVVWRSSGSTGEPGIFVQDANALAVYDALLALQMPSMPLAARCAWGLFVNGGRAALIAATGDHFASVVSWERVCRGNPWPNARVFSVMDPLPELVAALNEYQPAFLASYPTTLAMLAEEQRMGRLRIAPTLIWSGGEYLAPATAAAIERAFRGVLVNEYGASECMSIAFSCPEGWLHVNADWVVLEPVERDYRPTPPGQPSYTALLTNLANRVQPIVRYDLGDSIIANPDRCRCGSALPAIRAEGRRDDILALRSRDGRIVQLSPLALATVVEDAAPGQRFQLVQTGPETIAVRLPLGDRRERDSEWHATQRALHAYLVRHSLDNVHVRLDRDAPLPDPRSGKLREVIADLRA